MRRLSSKWTVLHKVVLPAVWIPMFAFGTVMQFRSPPVARNGAASNEAAWVFLAATILGSVFLYWCGMRLKKVVLDGDTLVVSDFGREERIPMRDVEQVSGSILMRPELVWLRFRRPTDFGNKIVFMPSPRVFGGYSRHPLVEELRGLVAQASGITHTWARKE